MAERLCISSCHGLAASEYFSSRRRNPTGAPLLCQPLRDCKVSLRTGGGTPLLPGKRTLVRRASEPTPPRRLPPCARAGRAGRKASEPKPTPPYAPVNFAAGAVAKPPLRDVPPAPPALQGPPDAGTLWGLLVLSLAYLHHSTTGFALPALLPIISEDLRLSDAQGALLTAGYTVLYALALVPVGLLADRVDRPRLLAGGIGVWSLLTMAASTAQNFGQLLFLRIGFAAAQATQNPICFSLIPELFPNGRTTAMALYNSAIYAGRALSFAALILAGQLGVQQAMLGGDMGYTLVPLDKVDLSLVSILYTQGEFAAVAPVYAYSMDTAQGGAAVAAGVAAWRQLLQWLGPPGLLMAGLALFTVDEPRKGSGFLGDVLKSSRFMTGGNRPKRGGAVAPAAAAAEVPLPAQDSVGESLSKLRLLVADPSFQLLTAAAALNDVGSWALVAWQATFYQRVFQLTPDVYAPLLAVVIPVGGIIGGVGAGVFGDRLIRMGARGLLTGGATILAAPVVALSLLAPDYKQSFAALLVGFALSEAWRAPAAVMVRDVSPPGLGSTASAVHLCFRNLVGGFGPIAIAVLSSKFGLQHAMLLVPTCYMLSGVGFIITEAAIKKEKAKEV